MFEDHGAIFESENSFISIRTAERSRALSFIAQLSTKLNLNIGYHTLSQGMRYINQSASQ